ncbi:MAG: hypothetical protein GY799_02025 [Desulfobulbaceae bacterium]|nr:hypothetical protein [Desulfobulbaceae bacterium]
MSIKAVYSALEGTEDGANLVQWLKDNTIKERDEAQTKVRTLENEAKAFEGLDIPTLKANTQFLEEKGGTDAVIDAIAKAGGYETDIAKVTAEKDAQKVIADQASSDYEKINAENARLTLMNKALPHFTDAFESSEMILETAMNRGMLVMGESGLSFKNGDDITSFENGGFESIKQCEMFKPNLRTPSGGGEGGGINGNNNNNSGDDSLESLFE